MNFRVGVAVHFNDGLTELLCLLLCVLHVYMNVGRCQKQMTYFPRVYEARPFGRSGDMT